MIAGVFTGAVITAEHLIMVIVGGAGAYVFGRRIDNLFQRVNGRIAMLEERIGALEVETARSSTQPPRRHH